MIQHRRRISLTGYTITKTNAAGMLLTIMFVTSLLGLLATYWTMRLERTRGVLTRDNAADINEPAPLD